jgi:hypothetical protein
VQYVRLARYGLLALIALLWWGERVLNAWMNPFFGVADRLFSVVQPLVLPSAGQWLR